MEKKDLAKMALAALLLAASLPATGEAKDIEASGTLLAAKCSSGACGSCSANQSSGQQAHCGGCGSTPAQPSNNKSMSHPIEHSTYETPVDPRTMNQRSGTPANRPSSYSSSYSNPGSYNDYGSGVSSYQGTTTGPGPNDGYPATPKGSYNTNYNTGTSSTRNNNR